MTVVYIDALFLLNLIVNYLLLLAAAKLAGEPLRRLRLAAGAALGGLYAAAIFFPGMGFLTHPLCKLGAAVSLPSACWAAGDLLCGTASFTR